MNKRFKQSILLIGDTAILHLALLLTLVIRYFNDPLANWHNHWPYFLPVFAIWLIVLYIGGAYDLNLVYNRRKFHLTAINSTISSAILSILYFYLNHSEIAPKTNLAIFSIVFLIIFILWRSLYNFIVKSYLPKNNLAIIGWSEQTAKLLEDIKNQPHSGFETALIFKNKEEIKNLPELIKEKNIHTLVISAELFQDEELRQVLFDCLSLHVAFYNFVDFYESINGKVPIQAIDQAWFIENLDESRKNFFNLSKRFFDLILSLILFIISLPFWPIIALIIKLESRGPVFFKQTRVGQQEINFQMIKFRTMKTTGNHGGMTTEHDNRITRFGNILRKTRLDEVPQVLNIIKGDMSFIGPRPERPEFVTELAKAIPFYKTRLLIKPGVTGWDQVSGFYHSPSVEDTIEKLQYDLYYLKHRSLYLDLAIFLKTIATVLGRSGR
jgi:exopolysaccharide biosynthesis polyprenyl glycosylphosphotransferase